MDTFTHAEISTISHLKQLITCMAPSPKTHTHNTLTIIAQLKSIYSPSSPRLQSYDVLFLRKGTTMLARAIGYWDTPFRSWQFLLEGSSSGGFLCALEDLWKKLLEMVPLSAQGEFGRVERRVVLTGG